MSAPTPRTELDSSQVIQSVYDEINVALQVEDINIAAAYDPTHTAIKTEDVVLDQAYDATNNAIRVEQVTGVLVPEPYDYLALTYVASGNGAGQIYQVKYYLGGSGGTLEATLTLGYDSNNNLITVART